MAEFDIEELLTQLTVEEKIRLLSGIDFWHTYAIPRLNIPSIRVSDGPNGVRGTRFFDGIPSACFPCGTALASTFNKELLENAGALMGVEAKHKGASVILGPTTNMQRGPLGGRGFESFSEDPYLAGMASASIVNGIQSENIAATIKHYVGNDLEEERNSSDSIITERALREIYMEPFRLAVKHSNPKAFMTGYNKINGEHVSQSKKFLADILRGEWAWDGTIMSDWYGTYTTDVAIRNGLDLEMPGPTLFRNVDTISHQLTSKELHINDVDDRVRGVLKLIEYAAGSGVPENAPETTENNTPETRERLNKIASESVVLLKNEDNILPLKKEEKIAVIGPNAKVSAYCGGGSASLVSYYNTTPYESIAKKLSSPPEYSLGCYAHKMLPGLAPFVKNPATGKAGYNLKFYYEEKSAKDRTLFDEKNVNQSLVFLGDYKNPKAPKNNLYYIDFEADLTVEETGEYEFGVSVLGTAQLFIDGKLFIDNKTKQVKGNSFFDSGTVEEKNSIKLEKGKVYKILIEFGTAPTYTINAEIVAFAGAGGVNVGFAKVVDPKEEIEKAVTLAKSVDKVVLSIGLNQEWESEGFDRPNMDLPGLTNDLVRAVLAANPNTVVVNQSGTPVEMPWLSKAKCLVQAWYGGSEAGNAIANVLFGDVNPSGRLSLSFPFKNVDNPTYLNFRTVKGRVLYGEDIYIGYRYYEKLQKRVAFPFGYGLSYTDFEYSNLKVAVNEAKDKISVSVSVKNVGKIAGSETVQLYISPKNPSIPRPIKELKGFEKVPLASGEEKTVNFELDLKDSISFFDEYQDKWCAEKGAYEVQVGKSSDDVDLIEEFEVQKTRFWLGL